ncbi:signal peptide protein [Cryptosporidium felis]|nr:signal peptide protein [Cryptosporidium felis]
MGDYAEFRESLSELEGARRNLELAISELEECNAKANSFKSEYELQVSVCVSMKNDYDKYCKPKLLKSPKLDEETCKKLLEGLKKCKSEEILLGQRYLKQLKTCETAEKTVKSLTSSFESAENKCSTVERKIYHKRGDSALRIVGSNPLLDGPICSISGQEVALLEALVADLYGSLQQCLENLSVLSSRLAQVEMSKDRIVDEASSGVGKKKKKKGLSDSLKSRLQPTVESSLGLKKLIFHAELECRKLETDLRKAQERLDRARESATRHSSERRRATCFHRVTRFFTRVYNRVTKRIRRRRNEE